MTGSDEPTEAYTLREELPSPETFLALRQANDMAERPPDAVEARLAHSSFGETVVSGRGCWSRCSSRSPRRRRREPR